MSILPAERLRNMKDVNNKGIHRIPKPKTTVPICHDKIMKWDAIRGEWRCHNQLAHWSNIIRKL